MSAGSTRRPSALAAAIVGFFAAVLVIVAVVVPTPQLREQTRKSPPVTSLLVQVRDDMKQGISSFIINADTSAKPQVQVTTLPADLALDLPDGSRVQLPAVTVPPYPQQAVDGLRVTTGLGVDGELVLERLGFAGLIDYVGGVNIRIDSAFTSISTSLRPVTIAPGLRHLRGVDALAYLGEGNPAMGVEQRDAHTRAVMQALLTRMSVDRYRVFQVLVTAGLAARSSVPTESVADVLVRAGRAARRHSIVWRQMPVTTAKVGAGRMSLVRQAGVARLIRRDSLQTKTAFGQMPHARLLIRDNSSIPNLTADVRRLLAKDEGVAVFQDAVAVAPSHMSGVPWGRTRILARNPRSVHVTAVAEALGVGASAAPRGYLPPNVDAVVLVGGDIIDRLRREL